MAFGNRIASLFKRTPPPPPPLTETPWRSYKDLDSTWPFEYDLELKKKIVKKLGEDKINIAFFGPLGSGKSSTINSYMTIAKEDISSKSQAGSDDGSYTIRFLQIPGEPPFENITFYDSMGMEEGSSGLTAKTAVKIAKGEIEPDSEFTDYSETSADGETSEATREKDLKIHCIVYVLDGENVKNGLKEGLEKKTREISKWVKNLQQSPNRVVLLTKVDLVCDEVKKDIKNIFKSRAVDGLVETAVGISGVPVGAIFPIKNYHKEQEVNRELNVPLLLALEKIVGFAKDTLQMMKGNK